MSQQQTLQDLLDRAGVDIRLNGSNPCDPNIHDTRLYDRVLREGSLGFGEGYMDGWVTCADLPELFTRVLGSGFDQTLYRHPMLAVKVFLHRLRASIGNPQDKRSSTKVGEVHYDDDAFNLATLGERKVGTCAYFDWGASSLQNSSLPVERLCLNRNIAFLISAVAGVH